MFDTALLESRRERKGRGKRAGLSLAIGLHVAVIGAFAGASVWSVGEPPEPIIPVTFFVPAPPGPSPSSGPTPPSSHSSGSGPRSHGAPAIPNIQELPVANDATASTLDTAPDDFDGPASNDPGDGSVRSGNGEGPGGGDGGSGQGGGPILRPGGDVMAPVLISRVDPDYPESLRRARIEGLVILEAVITADGSVEQLRVLRSGNPLLDHAVLDAVARWRYKPATLNGRAVSVYLTVTVTFGLKS